MPQRTSKSSLLAPGTLFELRWSHKHQERTPRVLTGNKRMSFFCHKTESIAL